VLAAVVEAVASAGTPRRWLFVRRRGGAAGGAAAGALLEGQWQPFSVCVGGPVRPAAKVGAAAKSAAKAGADKGATKAAGKRKRAGEGAVADEVVVVDEDEGSGEGSEEEAGEGAEDEGGSAGAGADAGAVAASPLPIDPLLAALDTALRARGAHGAPAAVCCGRVRHVFSHVVHEVDVQRWEVAGVEAAGAADAALGALAGAGGEAVWASLGELKALGLSAWALRILSAALERGRARGPGAADDGPGADEARAWLHDRCRTF